jgi:hypothetical protein
LLGNPHAFEKQSKRGGSACEFSSLPIRGQSSSVVTFALFFLAIFFKGFPHELLLETGVFLVSLKLILMAKKTTETERRLEQRLIEIQETLARPNSSPRY